MIQQVYPVGIMDQLPRNHQLFQRIVLDFYRQHARNFPWRDKASPYQILVSEVMLQQTQTDRVVPKFEAFIHAFPTVADLAITPQSAVIKHWQGLGYNRRGLYLHRAAKKIVAHHNGAVPSTQQQLETLPGIGPYTATAILAFAFNQPTVVLETNIRAAYLHHFYPTQQKVDDATLQPLVASHVHVDTVEPRNWYSALMDYGSYLKSRFPNPTRRSKHHTTQSTFNGSDRQIRGAIIRALTQQPVLVSDLPTAIDITANNARVTAQLSKLVSEGFVDVTAQVARLAE